MTTRTDTHRPSAINPAEYEVAAFKYFGGSDLGAIFMMVAERERLDAHMARTGGTWSQHEHGGICGVCGCGNITYAVVWHHVPTNTYIMTGEDCAQKMDMVYDARGFSAFRRNITDALEAKAGKAKAKATLEAAGLGAAWGYYIAESREAFKYEETTAADIVSKLVRYGSISDKQQSFLRALLERIPGREQRDAERAAQRIAEQEAAEPCPQGRVQITGTVVFERVDETSFGTQTRIMIRDDRGFKVWGNCTANAKKGDRITFRATVTVSDKDPKFGFFKRPFGAEILIDSTN